MLVCGIYVDLFADYLSLNLSNGTEIWIDILTIKIFAFIDISNKTYGAILFIITVLAFREITYS